MLSTFHEIVLEDPSEYYLNTLARYTTMLSTYHDRVIELAEVRRQLEVTKDQNMKLKAQLAGRDPPDEVEEIHYPAKSPPRKRHRYGTPGFGTKLLLDNRFLGGRLF